MAISSTKIYVVFLILYSASASDIPDTENATKPSKIFGGHPCGEDEIYSIVHVGNDSYYKCGGSMITNLWGLTAAHCVHNQNNYRLSVELINYEIYLIDTIYVYPEYNPANGENDIAMFYLKIPIPNGQIVYVQLPTKDEEVCNSLVVKGWGKTDYAIGSHSLLCVNLPLLASSKCQEIYGMSSTYAEKIICTLSSERKDACEGDSGGPLTCGKIQVGIVSRGPKDCGNPSIPGVYTKVSYFLNFINETMIENRKSRVIANGGNFKIVLASSLALLIFKYWL